MQLPTSPVTLSVEQIDMLNRHLSTVRHDINNCLALVVAAAELTRMNPEMADRLMGKVLEQPPKISDNIRLFSGEWEKLMGITKN